MRFSQIVFTIFLLIVTTFSKAQKLELGKVSMDELAEKTYPADTSAAAAILYSKAKSTFVYSNKDGFSLVHEYEFRIKIYKKQGLEWANFTVPYYVGYENLDKDMVRFSKAVTYNLENGKIVKTKLGNEGVFKNGVNAFWNEASIAMPNVKTGSVIEFKYTLKSQDIVRFPIFHFQYSIPVKYAKYSTEIPEFFIYKPIIIGSGHVQSDAVIAEGFQNYNNEYQQSVNMSYRQINSNYIAENMPALKKEAYVDNIQNYRSAIEHELEKTRFPNVDEKNYAVNWEGVAATIYKEKEFGGELRQRQYFEQFLNPYIKTASSEAEKATAVFEYVKRTMNWDNKYGYLTKKGVKQAFADHTGNAAEINLMLVAMLNHAGLDAYPVLVSTKDNGVPVFPNRTVFNYVVASVQIDGRQILYDATSKTTTANILPFRALNWNGRLIRRDGTSELVNLVPEKLSKQAVNMTVKIDANGALSGKAKIQKTDYEAYGFREKYAGIDKNTYVESLENDWGHLSISEYAVEDVEEVSKPVVETFTFASGNHSEIIGDKMYVNPMLFFGNDKNPFLAETRQFPIYYGYPNQVRYNISIEIPNGFAVASLPESMSISTGENVGLFTFNILNKENTIQVTIVQEINRAIVSAEFYEHLKVFYREMIEKQNEKIVLKKV